MEVEGIYKEEEEEEEMFQLEAQMGEEEEMTQET